MHGFFDQDPGRSSSPRWRFALLSLLALFPSSSVEAGIFLSRDDSRGAVASESSICSNIGIDLIRRGGNAVDAAVGTTLCVGVIGMYHSGIGGGGFMLVRSETGEYEDVDFRETAPAAAYENMYANFTIGSIVGGDASGVPGELRGFEYVHTKYGKLPWAMVVMPAAKVAERGFPVTEDLFGFMTSTVNKGQHFLTEDPSWAIDFAPNGTLLQPGEIMTRKRFGKTLRTIAQQGANAFYEGPIAEATIRAVQLANGSMTLDDMSQYDIISREPVSIDYRGYKMFSTGAPSSGAVALNTFKIIEGYNMSDPDNLKLNTHRLDEAIKFSYGSRNELGDPDFVEGIVDFQTQMLDTASAHATRHKISDDHTLDPADYNPKLLSHPDSHGTSHIVTTDSSGLSITLTTTINLSFGSRLCVPETGIIMNNEMNDFSIPGVSNEFGFVPSRNNYIRPGKRPLSSITPIIVEKADGSLYVVTGAAGGSRIITATIQALWHVLDHGMTMPEALAQPRLHDQLLPAQVRFEVGYDNATTAYMREKGHNVTWTTELLSKTQGIRRLENGTFEAAAEPRQKNSGGFAV
ncbi:gamma-glutamyltransferase [Pseudogymnoascus sp. 24MN13]|nr:gamma-glutamyltransferase [Pseudogymnoascus sp. 24MN13]